MDSTQPPTANQQDDLQFEQADYQQPVGGPPACVACQQPITESYFAAGDKVVCPACRDAYLASQTGGSKMGRLMMATLAGLGAAILGAAIYFAIAYATGYEFGLVAILVGFMVGFSVRWGSQGRGGWVYQLLAMALTYLAIVSTFIPPLYQGFMDPNSVQVQSDDPADLQPVSDEEIAERQNIGVGGHIVLFIIIFALACAAPFLAGLQNIMGLIIIAIGLYEAWKINQRTQVELTGPFRLADSQASA